MTRTRGPFLHAGAWLLFGLAASPLTGQDHDHAAMAEHDPRTEGAAGMAGAEPAVDRSLPPELPTRSELIALRDTGEEGVIEVVVGPVSLPADDGHLRPPVQLIELPFDGWLHGFEWEMRGPDGELLPDRLLHHVNFIDPDHRELFSPVARRVLGAGRETKRQAMPGLLGYRLEPGTRLLVSAMFANPTDEDHPEAYLHVRMFHSPPDDGWLRPRAVVPFYLDVMGPVGEKEFPLPPGRHGMAWEGRPAISGRVLGIGGHLHDYGDWIRLEDVTTGEVVWEAEPDRGENGRVTGVPTGKLWWRGGVEIFKDHVYRISVGYTNPLESPAPDGAMGAMGGILLVGDDDWPEFDRNHPDYVADLWNTLEKPNEAHHGHGSMVDAGAAHDTRADEGAADGRMEHDHDEQ